MTTKIVRIGTPKDHQYSIYCKIEYKDGKLSITGVEGPKHDGNCFGGCGQIIISYKEYDNRGYESVYDIIPAEKWNSEMIKKFFDLWDRWHLNDLHAECEHQRELGWTYENHHGKWIEKFVPNPKFLIDEYADGSDGEFIPKWDAYKGHNCPVCNYEIGSKWLKEDVPQEVIDWLFALPDTDRKPAWV